MSHTFQITEWDEQAYLELEEGEKYTKVSVQKRYQGKLIGEGKLQYLMAYHRNGHATFTGIEHVVGSLDGKPGSFTLAHKGTFKDGIVISTFDIIPDSTAGELVGVTGHGRFTTGHSMTVEFDFEFMF